MTKSSINGYRNICKLHFMILVHIEIVDETQIRDDDVCVLYIIGIILYAVQERRTYPWHSSAFQTRDNGNAYSILAYIV